MEQNAYVIVIRKIDGRAFSLKRDYTILQADLGEIEPPEEFVEDWEGWLPTHEFQRPDWVNIMTVSNPKEEIGDYFHAYWLY